MSESGAVLAAVKGKSLRDGLRPPLTAAPRSAPAKSGRDEEMSQARSNKEMQLTTPLTEIAPYKSSGGVRSFGVAWERLLCARFLPFANRRYPPVPAVRRTVAIRALATLLACLGNGRPVILPPIGISV